VFELIKEHLGVHEYMHTLLNPLPVYGLALGMFALAVAIALKSRPAQIVALFLVVIASGSAWPVVEYGEKGYDRTLARSDEAGARWLDAHAQRATRFAWVFYVVAGAAAIALLAPWPLPKSAMPLAIATLILGLVALGFGGWIAYAGGQIRHKEFRSDIKRFKLPPEPAGGYEKMRD
jgi:hypothetical protein